LLTNHSSQRFQADPGLHEVIWTSAEYNIKETTADVLVIFDCCHAGELERSVRSPFSRRAFEYLAATSAKSTTRKPGKESFTTALIWSLEQLAANHESGFSTQELLRTISHIAPDFPKDQIPRLSERFPTCLRKIVLAPLNSEANKKAMENSDAENEEDMLTSRQDLSIRFVFNQQITDVMVKELASGLGRLTNESEVKAKAILWEGINSTPPLTFTQNNPMVHMVAQTWLGRVKSRRKTIPMVMIPQPKVPKIAEASNTTPEATHSPLSIDGSSVATPTPIKMVADAEVEDSHTLDEDESTQFLHEAVTPSKKRGRDRGSQEAITPKKRKRSSPRK
jgi:hypothetical protein